MLGCLLFLPKHSFSAGRGSKATKGLPGVSRCEATPSELWNKCLTRHVSLCIFLDVQRASPQSMCSQCDVSYKRMYLSRKKTKSKGCHLPQPYYCSQDALWKVSCCWLQGACGRRRLSGPMRTLMCYVYCYIGTLVQQQGEKMFPMFLIL